MPSAIPNCAPPPVMLDNPPLTAAALKDEDGAADARSLEQSDDEDKDGAPESPISPKGETCCDERSATTFPVAPTTTTTTAVDTDDADAEDDDDNNNNDSDNNDSDNDADARRSGPSPSVAATAKTATASSSSSDDDDAGDDKRQSTPPLTMPQRSKVKSNSSRGSARASSNNDGGGGSSSAGSDCDESSYRSPPPPRSKASSGKRAPSSSSSSSSSASDDDSGAPRRHRKKKMPKVSDRHGDAPDVHTAPKPASAGAAKLLRVDNKHKDDDDAAPPSPKATIRSAETDVKKKTKASDAHGHYLVKAAKVRLEANSGVSDEERASIDASRLDSLIKEGGLETMTELLPASDRAALVAAIASSSVPWTVLAKVCAWCAQLVNAFEQEKVRREQRDALSKARERKRQLANKAALEAKAAAAAASAAAARAAAAAAALDDDDDDLATTMMLANMPDDDDDMGPASTFASPSSKLKAKAPRRPSAAPPAAPAVPTRVLMEREPSPDEVAPLEPFPGAEPTVLPIPFRMFCGMNAQQDEMHRGLLLELDKSTFKGVVPLTFDTFRAVCYAQNPQIEAIKNAIDRNAAVSRAWKEAKEVRERWCARRGRITAYRDFLHRNKRYASKDGQWPSLPALWAAYNDTWDALVGMSLRKRSATNDFFGVAATAAPTAASSSVSGEDHDAGADAMMTEN